MSAARWRCLDEFALTGPGALAGRLAAAVQGLALPGFVLERMGEAVAAAVAAVREQDTHVDIRVRVLAPKDARRRPGRRGWGFFQVRRQTPDRRREIDLYLFPE